MQCSFDPIKHVFKLVSVEIMFPGCMNKLTWALSQVYYMCICSQLCSHDSIGKFSLGKHDRFGDSSKVWEEMYATLDMHAFFHPPCIYVCENVYTLHIHDRYVCIICMYACTICTWMYNLHVCMICMHVCTICVCVRFACMYDPCVCMYVCMYVCVYLCMICMKCVDIRIICLYVSSVRRHISMYISS